MVGFDSPGLDVKHSEGRTIVLVLVAGHYLPLGWVAVVEIASFSEALVLRFPPDECRKAVVAGVGYV